MLSSVYLIVIQAAWSQKLNGSDQSIKWLSMHTRYYYWFSLDLTFDPALILISLFMLKNIRSRPWCTITRAVHTCFQTWRTSRWITVVRRLLHSIRRLNGIENRSPTKKIIDYISGLYFSIVSTRIYSSFSRRQETINCYGIHRCVTIGIWVRSPFVNWSL